MSDRDEPAAVSEAADALYSAAPEAFTPLRSELAKRAKAGGDPAAAKRIAGLRKPTVAASVVNRCALHEPGALDRLSELHERLRQAHEQLDAADLRELTAERRNVVADLTREALHRIDHHNPSTALRDEVIATFDAAVADPEVLTRLGRLTKSEHWSGFGVAAETGDSPELTLVRGGQQPSARRPELPVKRKPPAASTAAHDASKKDDGKKSATTPRLRRRLDKAAATFRSADATLSSTEQAERSSALRVKTLSAELAALQHELDAAKRELDRTRREAKAARARRREARSALDRAERQSSD